MTPSTPPPPPTPTELDGFPRQFARTRRFSLGVPSRFTVSPDGERVLFVRSASGSDPRGLLWLYENGAERILAGHDQGGGHLSPEERTRRERARETSTGVVSYAADHDTRLVAYSLGGTLWTVRTNGAAPPLRIPTPGPVTDPRPSPDGTLIAYVSGGALRVVGSDGTRDRPLAEPEGADVAYGLPDHVAAESIGRSRGYWWSPDSTALLVTRVDSAMVTLRQVSDPSRPDQPPRSIRYPAAGTANTVTTMDLVTVEGVHTPVRLPARAPAEEPPSHGTPSPAGQATTQQATTWRDPAFEYVVTADWTGVRPVVSVQTRDQRTLWVLAVDPVTGGVEPLSRHTDEFWVEFPPGAPLFTRSGRAVLPEVRADTRTLRIGGVLAPDGLQVRAVLGAAGEQGELVLFTANSSEDPTQVHVWSHHPDQGFLQLTTEPGLHTAAAGADTVVLDSRTEDGQTVTVLRSGRRTGRIAVLSEQPTVVPRPIRLVLGARESRSRLHLPSWYEEGSGIRLPVLLSPYAGPGMQVVTRAAAWYTAVCQWFAEQGFAVLSTDGRGTPGRGLRRQRAIVGDRLTPALEDQIDALHAAAGRHDALDLSRVGIRGWSFGGYLAAGAVLRRPDVFHAAVAGAAPTDRRLYDTYWEERYLGRPDAGHAGSDAAYERSSLLPLAHRLTRPLLLVHGLADDNVAPAHALRLSAALLTAGRPHTVLLLPGTGHLVIGEGVADALLRTELDFLRSSLDAGTPPTSSSTPTSPPTSPAISPPTLSPASPDTATRLRIPSS